MGQMAQRTHLCAMEQSGTVVKSTGSWYKVQTDSGLVDCRVRGKLRLQGIKTTNPLAVGDAVVIEREAGDPSRGVVKRLLPRRNYIIRRSVNLAKQTQIIAANLDQAVLIATLEWPKTHLRFIDRFAVTAQAYRVPLSIVFNKWDLYDEALRDEYEFLYYVYQSAGYRVLRSSAHSGEGLSEFKDLLRGKRSLLSGHSGVGKSSLINAVEPGLDLRTRAISEAHQQGQHTTTFAELHPLSFGGEIIDTPGIKGFGLVEMSPREIGDYFPEIFALKGQCKFHNCLHQHEPACAVKQAVAENQLAYTRYESYLNFLEGDEDDQGFRKDLYAT